MPLDRQAAALLKKMEASGLPPIHTLPAAQARAMLASSRTDTGIAAEPVADVTNRTIPGPHGAIPVRIYTPAGSGSFPVILYFHGGGWVIGDLDSVHGRCTVFANRAHAVVVSVDYRLAPEHPFPAAVDDCLAAAQWVARNAALLRADPERMAVAGSSAGANLATVTALLTRERGGPSFIYQLLFYPVTDTRHDTRSYQQNAEGYFLTRALMKWFHQHYLKESGDQADWRAAPLRAETLAHLPPTHVITCEFDVLRDEGEAYAARLREAGVAVTVQRYDGQIHGFTSFAGVIDRGREAIEDAGLRLRNALRWGWKPRLWL